MFTLKLFRRASPGGETSHVSHHVIAVHRVTVHEIGKDGHALEIVAFMSNQNNDYQAYYVGVPEPGMEAFGEVRVPRLVDVNTLTYQVDPPGPVSKVFDNGVALMGTRDYETLTELAGVSPAQGFYATCQRAGIFRLGAAPVGDVTCDVAAPRSDLHLDDGPRSWWGWGLLENWEGNTSEHYRPASYG